MNLKYEHLLHTYFHTFYTLIYINVSEFRILFLEKHSCYFINYYYIILIIFDSFFFFVYHQSTLTRLLIFKFRFNGKHLNFQIFLIVHNSSRWFAHRLHSLHDLMFVFNYMSILIVSIVETTSETC